MVKGIMNGYIPDIHNGDRHSIRLIDYDYTNAGAYFVTICTQNKGCLLGKTINGVIEPSEIGKIACGYWLKIPEHCVNVTLDEFVVMPNHLHGIIIVEDTCRGEVSSPLFTTNETPGKGEVTPPLQKYTLGQIVAYFKYQTTKQINKFRSAYGVPFWQRNYYEHIIRNEKELTEIREYIINNPLKWELDRENPENIQRGGNPLGRPEEKGGEIPPLTNNMKGI